MAFCTCEECARSELGTISDEETVGRLIFNPEHLSKKDQSVKPGAFPLTHIQHKGLSLVRAEKISDQDLKRFATAVASQKQGRTWHGLAMFPSKAVRERTSANGDRIVCLFDDPTEADGEIPENKAHALAIAAQEGMSEDDAREVRAAIMKAKQFKSAA
jgi:hypothetical protein